MATPPTNASTAAANPGTHEITPAIEDSIIAGAVATETARAQAAEAAAVSAGGTATATETVRAQAAETALAGTLSAQGTAATGLGTRLTADEATLGTQGTAASALAGSLTAQGTRLTTDEATASTQGSAVAAQGVRLTADEATLSTQGTTVAANASTLGSLGTRLTGDEASISTQGTTQAAFGTRLTADEATASTTGSAVATNAAGLGTLATKEAADVAALVARLANHTPLFNRAPRQTDDTNKGYALGDYWNYAGAIYRCTSNAAGLAAWAVTPTDRRACALDVVGSATAAYGMKLLRKGYTGACCQITRASDSTTLSVGFVPGADGIYVADAASARAFLAGTTGTFSALYDQSGNGNDATQATAANQPPVSFRYVGNSWVMEFANNAAYTSLQYFLNLPSGLSLSKTAATVVSLQRQAAAAGTSSAWCFGTTSSDCFNFSNYSNQMLVGNLNFAPIAPEVRASLVSVVCTSGALAIRENNQTAAVSTGSTSTVTGGFIGKSPYGTGSLDFMALLFYPRALTVAEQAAINPLLLSQFNVAPQNDCTLTFFGDSITAGYGVKNAAGNLTLDSIDDTSRQFLGEDFHRYNLGVPGAKVASLNSSFSSSANAGAALYRSAGKKAGIIIYGGTNDWQGGATAASVYALIQNTVSLARAAGYSWCAVSTALNGDASLAIKDSFNTMLRTGWSSFADYLIDQGADPTMGADVATAAAAAYYVDGLHPNQAGNQIRASYVAPAVKAFLDTFSV